MKTKKDIENERKIFAISLADSLNEAKKLHDRVMELERELYEIRTSSIGMRLSCITVELERIKPEYERHLRMAGTAMMELKK